MHVSVFYENFIDGVSPAGLSEREALIRLRDAGMDRIYIGYDSFAPRERELTALFNDLDLPVEGFHKWLDLPRQPDDDTYVSVIDAAARAGARSVLFVPGIYRDDAGCSRDIQRDRMISGMRRAVAYGRTKGISVCAEDLDSADSPFCTADGFRSFLDSVPGLGCCFDTGNLVTYDEDELAAFRSLSDRVSLLHIKDRTDKPVYDSDSPYIKADGGPAYPCACGRGDIRIKEIMTGLKKAGYDGTLVAEMFGIGREHAFEAAEESVKYLALAVR